MLFAEDTITALEPRVKDALARHRNYLVLGSQGPDIFYHNQRRRPSGLAYGSLMHRHGYGGCVAGMWQWARLQGLDSRSWAFAWTLGFATHAILDRCAHPYINSLSGWVEQGDPDTEQFRSMHPFLERLIDLALLRRRNGSHTNELDFHSRVTLGEAPPVPWVELMVEALRAGYRKAVHDSRLEERMVSAYLDTVGFYRFTNRITTEYLVKGLAREDSGEVGPIWLSIIHPPDLPEDIDILNERHSAWPHPCDRSRESTQSFPDLYTSALAHARRMVTEIAAAWATSDGAERIQAAVGNWNLSDGWETERPCRRKFSAPLPLRELQDRIRESIRRGDGGVVTGTHAD